MPSVATRQSNLRGFSLMELIVTVAAISVLFAFAVTTYTSHIQRARRSMAQQTLLAAANAQEARFLQGRSYTSNFLGLVETAAPVIFLHADQSLKTTDDGNALYQIQFSSASDAQGFTIIASAIHRHAINQECPTLTISSTGARTPIKGRCWK